MTATACFTFDNLGEAAELTDGTLTEADIGTSTDRHPSLPALGALLDLLGHHGVEATFFVEGWNGIRHPAAVRSVVDAGHELGMHGWMHEDWKALDEPVERALAQQATTALHEAAGRPPAGFRAPGGARTAITERVLRELGYRFDASLGDGMTPSRLPGGLPNVPFVWPGVDGYHYLAPDPPPPSTVRDGWLATLDAVAARGGLFLLICHPFITGIDPARLAALDAVIERARGDTRVRLATAGEVAGGLA